MTQLLGYRAGWTSMAADRFHAVPQESRRALCGVECVHFDGQPFTARAGHCRDCLITLRSWTTAPGLDPR